MARRRLRHEEYTVGWVCALPIELAAAEEMLDEEYENLEQDEHDNNIYSLGRIGDHKVVIVCLPAGLIGNNPAAAVATQMMATFTSIRFGLMVGIGGGVPSAGPDIRLGDVVVSQPHQGYGGVIQYDFGKMTPSGFRQTGFLNSPPAILLGAIAKLQANQLRGRSKLQENIYKLRRLPVFIREAAGLDFLFEGTYGHEGGSTCQSCSSDKQVVRQPRSSKEPVVHYGTIASGNQVMRDGTERDRVSAEFDGVLCFEMEAAGLMNNFPCLVVRGVCDYADSHKNKTWQAYAAGTAAAYAKEVLSVIPLAEVAKESTADETIRATSALNELLKTLPIAADAPFNSFQRQHEPTCLPDTRVNLLEEIYNWADREKSPCMFWLNGLAGTGKSTISRTIARIYHERSRLGASFFFSRGGGDVSHASKFVTSIAVQLANNAPSLKQAICDAISERSDIADWSLRDQWRHLVLGPLSKLSGSDCYSYILVVDALDECDDDNNIRIVLQLLAEARSLETVRLRVFLTSRPEVPIRHGFHRIPDTEHQDFVLHNISPSVVDHDIGIFLEHSFKLIAIERALGTGWPGEQIVNGLVNNASGLFIWAATACRFVREGTKTSIIKGRLTLLLQGSSSLNKPEKHLDEIYITVLEHSLAAELSHEEKEHVFCKLRLVLGSVVILFSPLSTISLSRILSLTNVEVEETLEDLHSILDVPQDEFRPVRLHHPSFRDFLLDKDRCTDPNFRVNDKEVHERLAACCIQLMSDSLKQDICGVERPDTLVADVESSRIERCLPPDVQYACLYWIQHLQKSNAQLCDNDQVHQFLQEHLLHWIEALGWIQKTSEGIHETISLEGIARSSNCPHLSNFIHDMKRFVLYNRSAMERAPLQTYYTALMFAPWKSIVRRLFIGYIPLWIRNLPLKIEENWNALLQTLEGHSRFVRAVAFSPDGKQLASASDDETIKLWDAGSGALLQTLRGHSDSVYTVAFSPDGKQLASASHDETIKLWDAGSGALLQTLEGHSDSVRAVAFSPDGKQLASASDDKTVKLWDAGSGALLQTLEGHSDSVRAVAFSPDGKQLASASSDKTVNLWDADSGVLLQTLKGHSRSVHAVAFSPDGKQLTSASGGGTVELWDAGSGAPLQALGSHSGSVHSVAFSPDSKQLASASSDETVKLWDAGSGAVLQTLKGHSYPVNAVAFSPDGKQLASVASDETVKLWDAGSGAPLQTPEGHSYPANAVAFSPDGKQLASVSNDETVKLWDADSGALLQTLEGHSYAVNAVAFSSDGKQLASASNDETVKLWDARSGVLLQTLEGHESPVNAVAFSPDGKQLSSASVYEEVKLWDADSGALLQTLEGHSWSINAVAFSPDSKQLASAADDKTVKLWDAGSGALLQTLEGHSDSVRVVVFSPDGKQMASASDDATIKLWDAGSGALLQTLKGHSDSVYTVAFSPDGKQLTSASRDKTVKLWNF